MKRKAMDLEGVTLSSPRRFKRADELGANIPHFREAGSVDNTDEAIDVPVPRAFYSSGLAKQTTQRCLSATPGTSHTPMQLVERPLFLATHREVFDPEARPERSAIRFSMVESSEATPPPARAVTIETSIRKLVSINSKPDVASAVGVGVYDRTTVWGGENPDYDDEDKKEMRKEVEELRRELFPDGHAFKDRDIDYHDPTCAMTASAKVYAVEQKEEKFDGDDWPQDDFY